MAEIENLEDFILNEQAFNVCVKILADAEQLSKPRLTQVRYNEATYEHSVLPSLVDFRIDVELAAKAALTREQFIIFRACYLRQTLDPAAVPQFHRHEIRQRVGEELRTRNIFHDAYFDFDTKTAEKREAEKKAERERRQRVAVAADARMRRRKRAAMLKKAA